MLRGSPPSWSVVRIMFFIRSVESLLLSSTHLEDISEVGGHRGQDDLVRGDGRSVRAGQRHVNKILVENIGIINSDYYCHYKNSGEYAWSLYYRNVKSSPEIQVKAQQYTYTVQQYSLKGLELEM